MRNAVEASDGDEPARVLAVDDHPTSRLKLVLAVQALGHQVVEASDGAQAVARIAEGDIDLVLLDLVMPNMNGYDVLAAMRDDPAMRDVPVIVVTGQEEADAAIAAIERGATDVLPKSFDPVLFRARVEACIARKRLDDRRREALAQLRQERDRVDALLSETLPARAVEELKSTGGVRPQGHSDVVVLLADVVDFTSFCARHPPEEAVRRLSALVEGFERISSEYGLEKIKTSGDAFIATGGLLRPIEEPGLAAIKAGIAMARATPDLADGWDVRIGIARGTVVSGVVGHDRHFFDVWGDTVNVASRLAGAAEPGSVCIATNVAEHVTELYDLEPLGAVPLRGTVAVEAYSLPPGARTARAVG